MSEEQTSTAVAVRNPGDEDLPEDQPPSSTALTIIQPSALLPSQSEMSLMANIARSVYNAAGMVPVSVKTPGQALALMLAGWELGVRPMTAMRHIFSVNGKTEPDAQLMAGMCRSKGYDLRYPVYTAERVAGQIKPPNSEKWLPFCPMCNGKGATSGAECETCEGTGEGYLDYTVEDAVKSGQMGKGGPWKQYTRDMLSWAVTKRLCRLYANDVINAVDMSSTRVSEAEAVMESIAPVEQVQQIGEASSQSEAPSTTSAPSVVTEEATTATPTTAPSVEAPSTQTWPTDSNFPVGTPFAGVAGTTEPGTKTPGQPASSSPPTSSDAGQSTGAHASDSWRHKTVEECMEAKTWPAGFFKEWERIRKTVKLSEAQLKADLGFPGAPLPNVRAYALGDIADHLEREFNAPEIPVA